MGNRPTVEALEDDMGIWADDAAVGVQCQYECL
jgi:hypothetical protein